ncbi:beta-microseminoprotein-like [Haliotis cracherodii]|uniref:beta-microseminoprotein-like n=1 Tax=Haliotis cracherodii TaxID=6455 RepID=UPI0039ED68E7
MYVSSLFLGLCLIASTYGFCTIDKVYTDMSKFGTITQYCMYRGLKMQVGSHIKTADCMECTCDKNGLSCCGYGIKGGVFGAPEGCKVIADGCTVLMVKADDETKDCFSGSTLIKH